MTPASFPTTPDISNTVSSLQAVGNSLLTLRLNELTDETVDMLTEQFNTVLQPLVDEMRASDPKRRLQLRSMMSDFALRGQIQQRMLAKPQGYSGDYLTLDWLYQQPYEGSRVDDIWNRFMYRNQASRAVRARIDIVRELIKETIRSAQGPVRMLDVASGPGRIERTVIDELTNPDYPVSIDLVDADPDAVEYSQALLADDVPPSYTFSFHHRNAFRFEPSGAYDAIWCCGLFDYLDERLAVHLLKRLHGWLKPGGTLLVGNFSPACASQHLMEGLYDWTLIFRSEDEFRQLALSAGFLPDDFSLQSDPTDSVILLKVRKSIDSH